MTNLKIGIVEDDLIIAGSIAEMLQESGYAVTEPATRYSEAIAMIEKEAPDLLLLDVNILGKLDGIEVARTVKNSWDIPYIFLTANTDYDTISRAKEVAPAAFLAKPITKAQLFAAIEIAMAAFIRDRQDTAAVKANEQAASSMQSIFVKDGYNFRKVLIEEIIYAESEQNYLLLYLKDGNKVIQRTTLKDFSAALDRTLFMQVHRSCVIALGCIEQILPDELVLRGGHTVPVSKSYRTELMKVLRLKS